MESLELRIKFRREQEFRDEAYYDSFKQLVHVSKNIRKYIVDISQIHGFKKNMQKQYVLMENLWF